MIYLTKHKTFSFQLECCGKFGPTDYRNFGQEIPNSCYANGNSTGTNDYFTVGCLEKITALFAIGEYLEKISNWLLIGLEVTKFLHFHLIFIIFLCSYNQNVIGRQLSSIRHLCSQPNKPGKAQKLLLDVCKMHKMTCLCFSFTF